MQNDLGWIVSLVFALVVFACSSNDPPCEPHHFVSGNIYVAEESLRPGEEGDIHYFMHSADFSESAVAPNLCDPENFSSILPISFHARFDSAYIDGCNGCIEVLSWSGPGCPLEPTTENDLSAFQDVYLRIAEIQVEGFTFYPPCNQQMNARFNSDGTLNLNLSGEQEGSFRFEDNELTILDVSEVLAIYIGGYLGQFSRLLRQHLYFTTEPLKVVFENNQLILSREDKDVHIVLIP